MEGARARARSLVESVTSAWLAGDHDTRLRRLHPGRALVDAPERTRQPSGPADASAALHQVLAPLQRPIQVTAVVPSDDGTRCVVELRSAATPPAFVTSVLSLRDGKISAGRTYTDLREHDQRPGRRRHEHALLLARSTAAGPSSPGPPATSARRSRDRWPPAGRRSW